MVKPIINNNSCLRRFKMFNNKMIKLVILLNLRSSDVIKIKYKTRVLRSQTIANLNRNNKPHREEPMWLKKWKVVILIKLVILNHKKKAKQSAQVCLSFHHLLGHCLKYYAKELLNQLQRMMIQIWKKLWIYWFKKQISYMRVELQS